MVHRRVERLLVASGPLVRGPDDVGLTHGSAMWVLRELGFSQGASDVTFNYYIKSLRKLGIPFSPGQNRHWFGRLARYSFDHLMELSLALTLRVYGALPDSVLEGIVAHRSELKGIYRRAYECRGHIVTAHFRDEKSRSVAEVALQGLYLDLRIVFSGGRLVSFGPPRALLPHEAVRSLSAEFLTSRASLPVHISHLAEQVVVLSARAPVVHRGPAGP
jgi:hypothetical protein